MGSDYHQVFIPLILSVYDSFRLQRPQSRSHGNVLDRDLHENYSDAVQRWYLDSKLRNVLPTVLVSVGCHLTSGLWSGASSTHICPLVVGQTRTVPFMQLIAAALDCILAITAYELCLHTASRGEKTGASPPLVWGSILLVRIIVKVNCASHADTPSSRQHRLSGSSLASLCFW